MKVSFLISASLPLLIVAVATLGSGCGSEDGGFNGDSTAAKDDASHGGWWCAEHGVPEKECSMCSSAAADAFKKKGDWCKAHNRAESQCFVCQPEARKKFAKLYEAKVGRTPPETEENR